MRKTCKAFHILFYANVCLAMGILSTPTILADDLEDTALSIAPKDVAFFSTSVNLQESWRDFVESRFLARLRAVPYIQELEAEFERQWQDPEGQLAEAKAWVRSPIAQNLLRLGQEMFSDETFVFGSDQWCDTIEGIVDLQNRIVDRMSQNPESAQQFLMELTKEDISRIRVPDTVFGFRIDDVENAQVQLDALEAIVRLGGSQVEQAQRFLDRLKRNELEDGQTLSITLDPGMLPLEEIEGPASEMAEKVVDLLEDRQFTFALGVKSKMLLIAFGEESDFINSVGENTDSLLDLEVMQTLQDADTTQLRTVGFASQRWVESQWKANFGKYFQNITSQFVAALEGEFEMVDDLQAWKQDIEEDARWMDSKINELIPEFGPILTWSRAIENGTEGFSYNWTRSLIWENAQPLSILDHAGQNPLMMLAFKQQDTGVFEEVCDYAFEHGLNHLKRFIEVAEEDDEERATALKVVDQAWPLVRQGYEILRDKIGPALDSNQTLISVAADWTLGGLPNMPAAPSVLPVPELGMACAVDDRELFLEGCADLFDVFDKAVEVVREFEPDVVPTDYRVPRPTESKGDGATTYTYEEWTSSVPIPGWEPQLVLGEDFLVVGYSQRQVGDMTQRRELETRPAWWTRDTPAAAISYFDFAGVVKAIRPWVEYGLTLNLGSLNEPVAPASSGGPVPTGQDVLQIWDCFSALGQAAGTSTVKDDGSTVSRWVWIGE